MIKLSGYCILLLAVFCCTLTTPLLSQTGRGGITGLVADSTGAPVPGADVVLVETRQNVTLSTTTTSAGRYTFPSLSPGAYRITVKQAGFKTAIRDSITVEVDLMRDVSISLEIGDVQESITVEAEAILPNTTSSTLGQLVSAKAIEDLPLNGRNVLFLVQLVPGVIPINGAVNETGAANRPGVEVSAMRMNGGQSGSVTYFVDGAPLTVDGYGAGATSPAYGPAQEGMQEFRLINNNMSASYASPGTGVISLVTKSGTDQWHGSGFFFGRPNIMAANNPFLKASQAQRGLPNEAPDFYRYQWGFSAGGPIIKNKLFIFGDYEWTQTRTVTVMTGTVASDAERGGDFSGIPTIYNPFSVGGDGRRVPFSNNLIPASMRDPVAMNMLQYMPRANQQGRGAYHLDNFFGSATFPWDAVKYNGRVDYHLNERHQVFGRGTYVDFNTGTADHYGNGADPSHYNGTTLASSGLVAYNYTISPTTLLQVRQSYARHAEIQISAITGDAVNFDLASVGFPSDLKQYQSVRSMPRMHVLSGFGSRVPTIGFQFISYNYTTLISLDKYVGNHNLKTGFEFRRSFINMGQPVAPSGQYNFDGTATSSRTLAGDGYAFASYMMGMGALNTSAQGFTIDPYTAQASDYYGLYLTDNWRVTPRLSLDMGIRWEVFGGRSERYGRLTWFDPDAGFTMNGASLRGGLRFAEGTKSPFPAMNANISPRLGLSYRLGDRTVVHAGGGMFYGPATHSVGTVGDNTDSYATNTRWAATENDAFGNTVRLNPLSNPFPNGLVTPTQGALGLETNVGLNLTTMFREQPMPRSYNWNAGVQHQLPGGVVVHAAYVGNRGMALVGGGDLNNFTYAQVAQYGQSLYDQVPNPFLGVVTQRNSYFFGRSTVPRWATLTDFPHFATGNPAQGINIRGLNIENSIYHSIQLKADKRLSANLNLVASFTGGKIIGTGNGPYGYIGDNGGQQNWKDRQLERAIDQQDVSRWFTLGANYMLPIGKGQAINPSNRFIQAIVGNWQSNVIFATGTGLPIIVGGGNWPNRSQFFGQRPDLVCEPGQNMPRRAERWISPDCFAAPNNQFRPGTAPRTLRVRTDGAFNIDASMAKNFPMGESMNLQLRVETFNLTNNVHLGRPNMNYNVADLSTFGRITSTRNQPRQFQFAARFTF
jgi:hypothetical protein